MTAPAVIQGQLVDVRNVHTHKSVLLSVHVPVEYAPLVTAAFGWPSMVSPVPVAVAGLERPIEARPPSPPLEQEKPASEALAGRQSAASRALPAADARADGIQQPDTAPKPKGGRLARQAGIACNERMFWRYLEEMYGTPDTKFRIDFPGEAASLVYLKCGIPSRAELDHNPEAAAKWEKLFSDYICWRDAL